MRRRSGSLGPLLIISAIDLLLCCLTAAVMLFLIFQPSQRADRSSALFQGDSVGKLSLGGQGAPVVILVSNLGDTKLVASPTSDYEVISSGSSKTTVYRSIGPAARLRLHPARAQQRFVAHLAVTKDGGLISRNKTCAGASEVIVDPSSDGVIAMTCPKGAECISEEEASNRPADAQLVLIPREAPTPSFVPEDQCYVVHSGVESLDTIRNKASGCSLKEPSIPDSYASVDADCLWNSFKESSQEKCNAIQGDRVAYWTQPARPLPNELICPSETDEVENK